MTLLKLGVNADPRTVIGGRRPAVRMIVTQGHLGLGTGVPAIGTGVTGSGPGAPGNGTGVSGTGTGVPGTGTGVSGPEAGFGIIEGNPAPVSKEAIARNVCDSGLLPIAFDSNGNGLDLGQEQRLFSLAQRAALGVRDGGCLWPGCDRPPSWCEAHHIVGWTDDDGPTNLDNGCLLCSAHHLKLHNEHWRIVQVHGRRWLDAPPGIRSPSGRTPLTSKSRLMLTAFPTRNVGSPVHAP